MIILRLTYFKKQLISIAMLLMIASAVNLLFAQNTPKLDLRGYQKKDGAISLRYEGDFIDPYFAMRSLLTAKEEGMDIHEPALRWIHWLINKQREDGRFERYCQKGEQYISCMEADADDVNMILWAQLLLTFSTDFPEMPQDFQQSYTKAINYLENELYDKKLGIYNVNKKSSVGLFMDNVEIAHAFFQLAALKREQNHRLEALQFELRALFLIESIERVFGRGSYYEISTQPNETKNFYPGAVAQIYPWVFLIPWKLQNNLSNFSAWYYDWNIELGLPQADFAWGIIAIAAKKAGHERFVEKWMETAKGLRPNIKWNILEETVYQILKNRPKKEKFFQNKGL